MIDIQTILTEDEIRSINEAISEAERETAAEIVPLITDASGRYDRGEDLFGVVLACASVAFFWWAFQGTESGTGWAASLGPSISYSLPWVLGTFVLSFMVGAVLATRFWFLRHLFTPKSEMEECLEMGAQRAFHVHALGRGQSKKGVLIYVSLFERMVHVLGDETVAEKFSNEDFAAVKDAVVEGFKTGHAAEGLRQAIALTGKKLARDFPASEKKANELPNELILFEQNL